MNGIVRVSSRYLLAISVSLFATVYSHAQSATPEVERGIAWLSAQVLNSGTLQNEAQSLATPFQNRAEAVQALQLLSSVPSELAAAIDAEQENNTEYLSRQIVSVVAGGGDVFARVTDLVSRQNEDGGFGGQRDYESNALDTAFAIVALKTAGSDNSPTLPSALNFLLNAKNAVGAYAVNGNAVSVFISAVASYALQVGSNALPVIDSVSKTNTWLLAAQQADGGWGGVVDTSLAYIALLGTSSDPALQNLVSGFLVSQQNVDGSWNGDPYLTALALRALVARPRPVPTSGTIVGRVLDSSSGQALAEAQVAIRELPGVTSVTNAEGKFSLADVLAGSYTIEASATGYASRVISFNLRAGTTVDVGSVVLALAPSTGILQGTATDGATGLPLAGVVIAVSGGVNANAATIENGSYKITGLAPGSVTVSASKPGYSGAGGTGAIVAGSVLLFNPTLHPVSTTGSLGGQVVDAGTQAPIAGVVVALNDGSASAVTGADGQFLLAPVPATTVLLSLTHPDYAPKALSVVVNGGAVTALNKLGLEKTSSPSDTGVLQGVVKDSVSGQPIADVTIAVSGSTIGTVNTSADGSYALSQLMSGSITVTASKAGYTGASASGTVSAGSTLIFSPELKASAVSGGVTGRVVDATSKTPLVGATVSVGGVGGPSTTTDADGRFTANDIAEGSYSVNISLTGYFAKSVVVFLTKGSVSDLQTIELDKSLSSVVVVGKVTDASTMAAISGASVTVLGSARNVMVDAGGNYRLEDIPQGTATLRFSASGYTSETVVLDLPAPGEYRIDQGLQVGQGSNLGLALSTDRPAYEAYAPTTISIKVRNGGVVAASSVVSASIWDANGNAVDSLQATYVDSQGVTRSDFVFAPGESEIILSWNTLAKPPGVYSIVAKLHKADANMAAAPIELAQKQILFEIAPTQRIESIRLTPLPAFTNLGATENIGVRMDVVNRSNIPVTSAFSYGLFAPSAGLIYSATYSLMLNPIESAKSVLIEGAPHTFAESGLYQLDPSYTAGIAPVLLVGERISVAPGTRIDPSQSVAPGTVTSDGDKRIRIDIKLQGVEQK